MKKTRISRVFVLVVLAVVSQVLFAWDASVKLTLLSSPTGNGTVAISENEQDAGAYAEKYENKEFKHTGVSIIKTYDYNLYLFAKPNVGFYVDKISTTKSLGTFENGDLGKESDNPRKIRIKLTRFASMPYDFGNYTAIFQAVHVNGVASTLYAISTKDLGSTGTCDVVFNVNKATSGSDYDVKLQQNGSALQVQNTVYNGTQVTVTVKYSDTNHHGTGIYNGTVTLTSKGDNSSATATITANSDLTPTFDLVSSLAFGDNVDVYVGSQVAASVEPTSKNKVASRSSPADAGKTGLVWNATITGADATAFQLESKNPVGGKCNITFTPQEAKNYSATLTLLAQYTDAYGNTINSVQKSVSLSGIAKQSEISQIDFVPSSFDFGAMRIGDAVQSKEFAVSKQNVGDITYQWTTAYSDIFAFDASVAGKVTITAKPTFPGTYTTTLKASGADTRTGQSGTTTAELSVSVNISLQKPTLVGTTTLDSAYIYWNKIDFADTYTVYEVNGSTETIVEPKRTIDSENSVTAVLAQNTTKTYKVLAKGVYNGTEYSVWTDAISLNRGTLTAGGVQYWNLYTGTQCTSVGGFSGTKISKKRVNLSHTFDKNGKALFDELYVFGETVSSDGATKITAATADKAGTAVTPCYVFKKNSDDSYLFDRVIADVGTATKQLPTADARNWTTNGSLKLYFTGWCPFGSNGKDKNDEGIIYIKGSAGTSVDIYLEDCQLYARKHTPNGNTIEKDKMPTYDGKDGNPSQGSASAIVVECTSNNNSSNPFNVNVHSMGNNILYSDAGCTAYQKVLLLKDSYVGQYSSSLYVRVTSDKSYTILSFDDKWPTSVDNVAMCRRTNGYIRFQKNSHNSPSIDIGNANTIVNFNGGQIELQNSQPAGNGYYNNTLAICHRTGDAKVYGIPLNYGYGICGDGVGGTVNFNDGSVNTIKFKPLKEEYNSYYEPLDKDGYSTALRCPKNTYVRGGTHNSDVQACATVTSMGASPTDGVCALVKADHLVETQYVNPETKLVTDGFYPFDETLCTVGPQVGETLSKYYSVHSDKYIGGKYGAESITPDKDGYVHLWVPGEGRKAYDITSWVVSMTSISVNSGTDKMSMGGVKTVPTGENDIVSNMLYAKLDDNMGSVLRNKSWGQYSYEVPLQDPGTRTYTTAKLASVGDENYNDITNEDDYTINDGIYHIVPIIADRWYAFCPPFDVANVYVVQSLPEEVLEQKCTSDGRSSALSEQAKSNLDVSSIMASKIALAEQSGSSISFATCYNAFINYAYQRDTTSGAYPRPKSGYYTKSVPKDYTDNYVGRQLLKSFQKGVWDANYFLYSSSKNEWKYDGQNFTTDWIVASPVKKTIGDTEYDIVMEAGKVYALMFPYCTNCESGEERTQWDYWTGKLLIFEGFGPQTIKGKNYHSSVTAPYTVANRGALRGNPTCASVNPISAGLKNTYFQTGNNTFEYSNMSAMGETPMGGVFMLANGSAPATAPANAKAIHIRSGAVTYEDNAEAETGVPTIAGGHSLIVNSVAGGVEVVPVEAQQVSVYGSAGQLVVSDYMTDETTIALPAGIYIVRGEKEMVKVVVR